MTFSTWLLFLVTETALILTPGPAVIYAFSRGLTGGPRATLAATLGVVTGNTIYFVLSATGLGALIIASQEVFQVVKWAGAAYLVWLGLNMFFAKATPLRADPSTTARDRIGHIYRVGAVVQLSNPKNLVFFIAILPVFIDPTGNVPLQILILGLTSQIVEFVILMLYGTLAGRVARLARSPRYATYLDRVAGSLLVAVGVGLALVRHEPPNLGPVTD